MYFILLFNSINIHIFFISDYNNSFGEFELNSTIYEQSMRNIKDASVAADIQLYKYVYIYFFK